MAGWLLPWLCSPGRSGALGEWSLAEQRQLSHRPCCISWMLQPCLRVLTGRKALQLLHLHMGWPSLFLFRGSKIPCTGPGGRSLRISPTTTDSEYPLHGHKASPHLLPSPRVLTLLAIPAFPQASSCSWLFSAMCLIRPVHTFIPKSQQNKSKLFQAHVQKRHHLPCLPTTPLFPSFVV